MLRLHSAFGVDDADITACFLASCLHRLDGLGGKSSESLKGLWFVCFVCQSLFDFPLSAAVVVSDFFAAREEASWSSFSR